MSPVALRRQIGQLLIAGFNGADVPVELRSLAREFGLGGAILFARNIVEPSQVADLSFELARLTPEMPAWVSVDQEGGRVARLKSPFTVWPPMASLGRGGDLALADRFARALAAELRAVGITLDFAPVLDVHTNAANPVIGDRALSDDAEQAAELGATIVRALQAEGVAACGKHFPGHGDTNTDSHHDLPIVEAPPDQLRAREFKPFAAAIAAGVATIMTAHVLVPSVDAHQPATLSKRIITGLLRDGLGFEGVILSDDLEMKALARDRAVADSAVEAIRAGCDGVLICSGDHDAQASALEALIRESERDPAMARRIDDALARSRRVKERFLAFTASRPLSAAALRAELGREEHRLLADEMARYA